MKTRQEMIDALPDNLINAAAKELSFDEKWINAKTNVEADEMIFDLALEMQRLQRAMNATNHLSHYDSEAA